MNNHEDKAVNILVVDDAATNRELAKQILVEQGYKVDTAMDGAAALEQLASQSYDLVLLDIHMPGLNGFDVCRRIQQQVTFAQMPVILLSATNESADILTLTEEAGAASFLAKPFVVEALIQAVAKALECQ